jgi:hypothetical protein
MPSEQIDGAAGSYLQPLTPWSVCCGQFLLEEDRTHAVVEVIKLSFFFVTQEKLERLSVTSTFPA